MSIRSLASYIEGVGDWGFLKFNRPMIRVSDCDGWVEQGVNGRGDHGHSLLIEKKPCSDDSGLAPLSTATLKGYHRGFVKRGTPLVTLWGKGGYQLDDDLRRRLNTVEYIPIKWSAMQVWWPTRQRPDPVVAADQKAIQWFFWGWSKWAETHPIECCPCCKQPLPQKPINGVITGP